MRELRWVAQYADGRIIREYDFTGSWARGRWVENWFVNLDLSQVISFGLEGSGLRIGFRVDDGIIGINGKALELALEDHDGRVFPLTGRRDVLYKVVQYKEAHSSIGSGSGRIKQDDGIDAYCVGWETEGKDEKLGEWQSRLIARVQSPEGEAITVNLWFMCSNGFIGTLRIRIDGKERPAVSTILRPGTTNKIAMHVW